MCVCESVVNSNPARGSRRFNCTCRRAVFVPKSSEFPRSYEIIRELSTDSTMEISENIFANKLSEINVWSFLVQSQFLENDFKNYHFSSKLT